MEKCINAGVHQAVYVCVSVCFCVCFWHITHSVRGWNVAFRPELQRGEQITVTNASLVKHKCLSCQQGLSSTGPSCLRRLKIRWNDDGRYVQRGGHWLSLLLQYAAESEATCISAGASDFNVTNSENCHRWGGEWVQVTPRDPGGLLLFPSPLRLNYYKRSQRFYFGGRGRGAIITSEGLRVAAARGLKWVSLWHMTFLSGWRWEGNVLQRLTSKSMLLTTACSVFSANLFCLALCMN